ncbi:virion structural protein [Tenacibaculum phage Gundel_1]|uniref:Tail fiber protein H n=1 Tax=Tenacibaculum phage Gundel_1 TaxID=2745672 RepID=A0A8E4ZG11_9CAUD|nr:virion structural protein [Tenacibaculum phage Gundel_1]QQV91530.1 tail fiber protein H [Tenacibaculum phage Gundel_1]
MKQMNVKFSFPVGIETTKNALLDHEVPNLSQINSLIQGNISHKVPVKVEAHTNIDIATGGLFTQDSYAIQDGDRVLLVSQTNPVENGIYIAGTGTWTRATDADEQSELKPHTTVVVTEGDHTGRVFSLINTSSPVVGTDPQNWILKNIIITSADEISVDESNLTSISGANQQVLNESINNKIDLIDAKQLQDSQDIYSALGLVTGEDNYGPFTGTLLPLNSDSKQLFQVLETAVETAQSTAVSASNSYNFNKSVSSTFPLASGAWNTVLHNFNEQFVSSVQVFDENNSNMSITDSIQWRPKLGDNNAIEIYQESGSAMTATIVVRK